MKKALLTLLLSLITVTYAAAQRSQQVSILVGQQKTVAGKLRVKFIEVLDDSRCPVGTTCIWAGNAKVKLEISRGRHSSETVELNSNTAPTSVESNGYRFAFVSLTRRPTQPGRMTMVRPKLVVRVTPIVR